MRQKKEAYKLREKQVENAHKARGAAAAQAGKYLVECPNEKPDASDKVMSKRIFVTEVAEVFFGTLGIGFITFGIARGIHNTEKLLFVPLGIALAGYVYYRQRKSRL